MRKPVLSRGPALLAHILLALFVLPSLAGASILIEGSLDGVSGSRIYDLTVEVSVKAGPHSAQIRPLQTIRIPQVAVAEGRFRISLDTDLAGISMEGLTIAVNARPSESHRPFVAAVVSNFSYIP